MTNGEHAVLHDRHRLTAAARKLINDKSSFGVILLDIDEFRKINTLGGDDAGDQVLEKLGECLLRIAAINRGSAFRTSGDEFGMLLPGASLENAFLVAEEIRKEFARKPSSADFKVTVSLGVASYPRDAKDYEGVIRAASAALYTAKENGRDRVALPPNEEMVMKTCYYTATSISRLKQLAAYVGKKESELFREALDNLLQRYDEKDKS